MNSPKHVIVINKAGKAGKSTLSKHLISPMLNAQWIQIETFNHTGRGATATVAGRNFSFVAEAILASPHNKCIDIGNSNYAASKKEMSQIDGFAEDIAYWVIPCKENAGMMNDSLSTVSELINDLSVEPSRIVIVPNEIENPEYGLGAFEGIKKAAAKHSFHFCELPVLENSLFDELTGDPRSIFDVASDETDFGTAIMLAKSTAEKGRLAKELLIRKRALSLAKSLRGVWQSTPLHSLTDVA